MDIPLIEKPCRFCGSKNLLDCYLYIKCQDCKARGPAMNEDVFDEHADWTDHAEAIEAWNAELPKEFGAKNGI